MATVSQALEARLELNQSNFKRQLKLSTPVLANLQRKGRDLSDADREGPVKRYIASNPRTDGSRET